MADGPPGAGELAREPLSQVPATEQRVVALIEVLLCSGYPTQLLLGFALSAIGLRPTHSDGALDIHYIVALSLTDAVLLIALIAILLLARGERPAHVFLGHAPPRGEARLGISLIAAAFVLAMTAMATMRVAAPWLRTIEHNPLQDLLRTPRDAALFSVVVVVAGGLREEVQRAFILHRFEQSLGGGAVGVLVSSVAFGAGHLMQGADAAIATGLLGAFWAVVYLRRRSVIAPIVSHAGFDLAQVLQFLSIGR